MPNTKQICICGGGGLGHTCAAVLSSHPEVEVTMYTQHPDKWQQPFIVDDPKGKQYVGMLKTISNNPADIIPTADIILFCLPAFFGRTNIGNHKTIFILKNNCRFSSR